MIPYVFIIYSCVRCIAVTTENKAYHNLPTYPHTNDEWDMFKTFAERNFLPRGDWTAL